MGDTSEVKAASTIVIDDGNGDQSSGACVVARAKYSKRVIIKSILGREDGGLSLIGQVMVIGGWVKTGREQGKGSFAFLEVNDGSCFANLQVSFKETRT
jgi:asparaginyl-tRNA synthetase